MPCTLLVGNSLASCLGLGSDASDFSFISNWFINVPMRQILGKFQLYFSVKLRLFLSKKFHKITFFLKASLVSAYSLLLRK